MGTCYNRLGEAVLTSAHNLCFEQKYEKYQNFLSENFQILEVKFSRYLNRHFFIMWNFSPFSSSLNYFLENNQTVQRHYNVSFHLGVLSEKVPSNAQIQIILRIRKVSSCAYAKHHPAHTQSIILRIAK